MVVVVAAVRVVAVVANEFLGRSTYVYDLEASSDRSFFFRSKPKAKPVNWPLEPITL